METLVTSPSSSSSSSSLLLLGLLVLRAPQLVALWLELKEVWRTQRICAQPGAWLSRTESL